MTHTLLPAIWLIVGLPQLSETVYTPSLPDIAHALSVSEAMVEYTLTIYLFGFAFGALFWGRLSDNFGRKTYVIIDLIIFIVGRIGYYISTNITHLMISRLIQAFGGRIGSVLGQAICRDAFHGPALGKVYSATGSALALFPALGPLFGGLIVEIFEWRDIFVCLTCFAFIVTILVSVKLSETHPHTSRKKISVWNIAKQLIRDKNVIGFGLIVGGCNGILFSYFAEGSFYLIKGLGLSPSHYGLSFTVIAVATMLGGIVSKRLQNQHSSKEIMGYGLLIIAFATTIFGFVAMINHHLFALPSHVMIGITILSQMGCAFGICMATSNSLALALADYKHAIGTAFSLCNDTFLTC